MDAIGSRMEALGNIGTKTANKMMKGILPRSTKRGASGDGGSEVSSTQPSFGLESLQSAEGSIADSQLDWLTAGDYYLHIVLHEGINIAAADVESADLFVRVRLGEDASRLEGTTRVCYNNSYPVWEESLLFPLRGKQLDTPMSLAVYCRNDVKKPKFLGQVCTDLGCVLSGLHLLNEEMAHRAPLKNKSSDVPVGGEMSFGISVVDQARYMQLYFQSESLLDSNSLNAKYGSTMLQLSLHDIKNLQAVPERLGPLSLEVRIGRSLVKKGILMQENTDAGGLKATVATLGDSILIPLSKAFRKVINPMDKHPVGNAPAGLRNSFYGIQGMMNKVAQDMVDHASIIGNPMKPNKEKNEIGDIKIYVRAGKEILAKTQIPIWTVPKKADEAAPGGGTDGAATPTPGGAALDKLLSPFSKTSESLQTDTSASLGKRFSRHMQNYRKDGPLIRLELAVSLQLRPKEGAPAAAVETVEESDPEEEEVSSPAPYNAPPDLDTPVLDTTVECGPNKMYRLLFKADSEVVKRVTEIEKLTNVVMTPLVLDPVTKTKSRTTTYLKPLNLNIPFVPKEAPCTVLMTVQSKEDGGWCVTQKIETKAPQGDAFYVLMQWVAIHMGVNKTRIKATMHIEFLRNVMTKSIIQAQATAGSKKSAEIIIGLIREQLGGSPVEAAAAAPGGVAAAGGVAAEAGVLGLPLSMSQLLDLLKLFILLLIVWHLSAAITRSADKVFAGLKEVAAALRTREATSISNLVQQHLSGGEAAASPSAQCNSSTP